MRVLIGLGSLWVLALVAVLALALTAEDDPVEGTNDHRAPDCQSLQDRASRCQGELARAAGDLVEEMDRRSGRSPAAVAGRRLVVEGVVHQAIADGEVALRCREQGWLAPPRRAGPPEPRPGQPGSGDGVTITSSTGEDAGAALGARAVHAGGGSGGTGRSGAIRRAIHRCWRERGCRALASCLKLKAEHIVGP